jgi:hypothetical protein
MNIMPANLFIIVLLIAVLAVSLKKNELCTLCIFYTENKERGVNMSACFPTRIKDLYCHFPRVKMLYISIRAMLIDISVYSLAIRRPYG